METNIITKFGDTEVYIGTYGDKWIAATGHSPYFCLEADSADELDAKLDRLIAFVKKAAAHFQAVSKREREQPKTFIVQKKIRVKELEDA